MLARYFQVLADAAWEFEFGHLADDKLSGSEFLPSAALVFQAASPPKFIKGIGFGCR